MAKETLILIIGQGINERIKTELKIILKMLLKIFKCVCVSVWRERESKRRES